MSSTSKVDDEDLSLRIRKEALAAQEAEPELSVLLQKTVLAPGVVTFEDAVASTISYRLLGGADTCATLSFSLVEGILKWALEQESSKEMGYSTKHAVREDVLAVYNRDPACKTVLEVVLFFKGFAALVCHRAARRKLYESPTQTSMVALYLQSQASAMFGVDIHPGATIGAGVLLDHGTGVVIGETAVVGNGCTLLHGVTLGGTGKENGDRHPKVGENVLVGANSSILGNIRIGNGAKIGAGSIVLRPIPPGATAVGAPAKIIGRAKESNPAVARDLALEGVHHFRIQKQPSKDKKALVLHKDSKSMEATSSISSTESDEEDEVEDDALCPYRGLRKMGRKNHSRGSVTFDQMEKMLKAEGATTSEIGEMFFDMDREGNGRVSLEDFEKMGASTVRRHSTITQEKAEKVVQDHVAKNKIRNIGQSMAQFGTSAMRRLQHLTSMGSDKAAESIEILTESNSSELMPPEKTSEKIISEHLNKKNSGSGES